jgi:N-methylhydantoinase A/oxoprolinase/acetone carboxylase beta subunit
MQEHRSSGRINPRTVPAAMEPLTEDQHRFIQDLFKKYHLQDLSVEEAVEIIEELERAGIHGPAVRALVLKAGLDPQKFKALISSEPAPQR